MNVNLKIWRQRSGSTKGVLKSYRLENIDPNISFLEMMDILNIKLVKEKKDPVTFDHDCREGICGSCGFMINGRPHGPQKATTVCQLHMRAFNNEDDKKKEIWINTSEAEILPAINPSYEISKLLIGQIITFKKNFLTKNQQKKLTIRKIILGPFKSDLNPIGIMSPELVASLIFYISKISNYLIVVSPNPLTYILFPLKEFYYFIYYQILKHCKRSF